MIGVGHNFFARTHTLTKELYVFAAVKLLFIFFRRQLSTCRRLSSNWIRSKTLTAVVSFRFFYSLLFNSLFPV